MLGSRFCDFWFTCYPGFIHNIKKIVEIAIHPFWRILRSHQLQLQHDIGQIYEKEVSELSQLQICHSWIGSAFILAKFMRKRLIQSIRWLRMGLSSRFVVACDFLSSTISKRYPDCQRGSSLLGGLRIGSVVDLVLSCHSCDKVV